MEIWEIFWLICCSTNWLIKIQCSRFNSACDEWRNLFLWLETLKCVFDDDYMRFDYFFQQVFFDVTDQRDMTKVFQHLWFTNDQNIFLDFNWKYWEKKKISKCKQKNWDYVNYSSEFMLLFFWVHVWRWVTLVMRHVRLVSMRLRFLFCFVLRTVWGNWFFICKI